MEIKIFYEAQLKSTRSKIVWVSQNLAKDTISISPMATVICEFLKRKIKLFSSQFSLTTRLTVMESKMFKILWFSAKNISTNDPSCKNIFLIIFSP